MLRAPRVVAGDPTVNGTVDAGEIDVRFAAAGAHRSGAPRNDDP